MIHGLDGPVMPYAWGSHSALAELLGRAPSGQPEAELWIGAHPAGSARLTQPVDGSSTLSALLGTDLPGMLGTELAARYGRLPFLLKILAIDAPLSLQAHPDAEQAMSGFAREEALGLDRADASRNYKDDNHKPELILALSPVEALCGFRPHGEVCNLLSAFGLAEATSPLAQVCALFSSADDAKNYEALFRAFFELSRVELQQVLARALAQAGSGSFSDASLTHTSRVDLDWVATWLLKLDQAYGVDPGLLGALLLRPLRLEPGQALFLPARRLHAYLSGVGVEVMAESDNVLRGGLTPKHVDVEELCRVLDFRPSVPDLVVPHSSEGGQALVYRTPAREFELWFVEASTHGAPIELPSPCLFVVLDGQVELTQGSERAHFARGQQGFVSWSSDPARLIGHGRVALAAARGNTLGAPVRVAP